MAKLVVGCGYLGGRVARRWLEPGETVYVVTRSADRAAELRAAGYRPIVADVTQPETLAQLPRATTVLYAVGYDRTSGKPMREVYLDGLRAVLDALPEAERIIYVGSTGVYGQAGGVWVDEESPTEPVQESGRICLAAEELLAAHRWASRSIVLRLAGLYGPGRIPHRQPLVAGQPLAVPSQGYLNLIHVDDAAEVVLAAEARAVPPRTYTVADNEPALRADYYVCLARLLGAPPPRFVEPPADSPAARRAASDKRVSNARMLAELGVRLAYPSYRQGLAAIVAEEAAGGTGTPPSPSEKGPG